MDTIAGIAAQLDLVWLSIHRYGGILARLADRAWLVIGNQRAAKNERLLRQRGEALPLTYERR
ncbi:MAG: hypothetical protein ABSC77_02530 [Terracidiphilus sp.]